MKKGNDVADHHAGLGVRECPSGEANRIRNLDSKTWWFQERMVQALMRLPKSGRHPNEKIHLNESPQIKYHITDKDKQERDCSSTKSPEGVP